LGIYLTRQNEFRFLFNKYKNIFSFLAVGFYPKNAAFARKKMASPKSGGLQPPASLARTPMALR